MISGIILVIRNGLRWRDLPKDYSQQKTIHNGLIRWGRLGVFNHIYAALAAKVIRPDRLMVDLTHFRARRTNRGHAWQARLRCRLEQYPADLVL